MAYVHGYDAKDQASTLVELLHSDTSFDSGASVLEAGCGVGAQTAILASNSPAALITSIDLTFLVSLLGHIDYSITGLQPVNRTALVHKAIVLDEPHRIQPGVSRVLDPVQDAVVLVQPWLFDGRSQRILVRQNRWPHPR
jgi:hypothetical protein